MREDKVLVVEDDPSIAGAVEKAGERLQLQVEVATDGWDAIEKLRCADYAAIVIDSEVPRSSGFGVITWLRQEIGDDLGNVVLMTSAEEVPARRTISEQLHVIPRTDVVEDLALAVQECVAAALRS
ncbi:MAG TPA: response regulator [Thermoanaerobaculia bacterium]|jgi:DNA-binding response OmpR family regulator|nr:response regulator [Thermoanaerobaculia bacterium]